MAMERRIGRVPLKLLVAIMVPVALITLYVLAHTNFLLGRALLLAFPGIESTYRGAWPTLTGSIVARDVTVYPFADPDDAVHFESVRLELSFDQWLRSVASGRSRSALKLVTHMRLVLDGAQTQGDVGYSPLLVAFGDASASPFEAGGCLEDDYWVREELYEMGLEPGPTRLELGYRLESGQLVLDQALSTPGASKVQATHRIGLRGELTLLGLDDPQTWWVEASRWTVEDQGFVAARNRLCARRDGVTPSIVAERHVAVLEQLFASEGLAVAAQPRELYRRFSQQGGRLELELNYHTRLSAALRDQPLGEWTSHLGGRVALNGESADLGLTRIAAQPLPESQDEDESLEAAMLREGLLPTVSAQADGVVAAQPDAAVEPAPDTSDARASSHEASARPPLEASGGSAVRNDADTPDGKPALKPGAVLDYRDLGRLAGARVRVHSRNAPPRVVQIVSAKGGTIQVRQRAGAGWAQYDLSRNTFVRAELLALDAPQ